MECSGIRNERPLAKNGKAYVFVTFYIQLILAPCSTGYYFQSGISPRSCCQFVNKLGPTSFSSNHDLTMSWLDHVATDNRSQECTNNDHGVN